MPWEGPQARLSYHVSDILALFSAPPHGSEPRCPHAKTSADVWLWWSGRTVSKQMRDLDLVTPRHFSYFPFIYSPPHNTRRPPARGHISSGLDMAWRRRRMLQDGIFSFLQERNYKGVYKMKLMRFGAQCYLILSCFDEGGKLLWLTNVKPSLLLIQVCVCVKLIKAWAMMNGFCGTLSKVKS